MFKFMLPSFHFDRAVERWKWSSEYRVYVSTLGHVKDEHKQNIAMKINQNGYCLVRLGYTKVFIHRLVLKTWRPIADAESMTVDHLNHNKRDNSLMNLEWVSQTENLRRATADLERTFADPEKGVNKCNRPISYPAVAGRIMKSKGYKKAYEQNDTTVDYIIRTASGQAFKTVEDLVQALAIQRPSMRSQTSAAWGDSVLTILHAALTDKTTFNNKWIIGNLDLIK